MSDHLMVAVAEIGAAMGRRPTDVEDEARELGLTIRLDWAGRPALSVDEARALASGAARIDHDHQIGWQAHLAECKDWWAARDQAARDAARKIRDKARRGMSPGMVAAEAGRAATEAAKHYERTVPRPRFNGTTAAPLEYISPEEAPK
jgi:hypothetical protein